MTLKLLKNENDKKKDYNKYKHKKCKSCDFSFIIDCETKRYIIRK